MHLLSNESAAVDHAVSELKYELSGIGCCHIPAVLRKLKRCPNVQHQPPAPPARVRTSAPCCTTHKSLLNPQSQVRSLWLSNNDIGLHGLIMLADFVASVPPPPPPPCTRSSGG